MSSFSILHFYDPSQLLDAWHDFYDLYRHHIIKGHIAARSGDKLLHRVVSILDQYEINYAVTGLAAAWIYTHFANFRNVTFYFHHPPNEKIVGVLNFLEDQRGANTWLVVPAAEGGFQGSRACEEILCVHPVQIYLDLKVHPERSSEAASMFRKELLNWEHDA